MNYKLCKNEKLCSRTAIGRLFDEGDTLMAYPLRAVFKPRNSKEANVQFLISIPKKRIHRAVDRVLLRRRVREAYRLHRGELLISALHRDDAMGCAMDVAFVYVGNHMVSYAVIESKMISLLTRMATAVASPQS